MLLTSYPHIKIIDYLQTKTDIAIRKACQIARHAAIDAEIKYNQIKQLLPSNDDPEVEMLC